LKLDLEESDYYNCEMGCANVF